MSRPEDGSHFELK